MAKVKQYLHQNTKKIGYPPGSLTYLGNRFEESSIDCHIYDQKWHSPVRSKHASLSIAQ